MGTFWLIAGPNGVGKTTYAFRALARTIGSINFVNLDEIARGLSPLDPRAAETDAARVGLARARAFIKDGVRFAMETTLAGRTHFGLAAEAKRAGVQVNLQYFAAPTVEVCLDRIARRVAEGGHDVADAIVRRRFDRSLANLAAFLPLADLWRVFDGAVFPPKLVVEGEAGALRFTDAERLRGMHPALGAMIARLKDRDDE